MERQLAVVARPGEGLPAELRPGDLVVWRGLGEGALAGVEEIADGELRMGPRRVVRSAAMGLRAYRLRGRYVAVRRRLGARRWRRIANRHGRVPRGILVLRRRRFALRGESAEPWEQTALDVTSSMFASDPTLLRVLRGKRKLRKGSRGKSVAKVQEGLVNTGLMLPEHGIDGIFGSETEQTVKDFQRLRSIPETGVVDARTLIELGKAVQAVPLERRLCAVMFPDPCVGKLEVACPKYLRGDEDGDVVGTFTEQSPLSGQTPDTSGFRARDTLWYKTALPADTCTCRFRVHHVAKDASGKIFHVLSPNNPDKDWHRI